MQQSQLQVLVLTPIPESEAGGLFERIKAEAERQDMRALCVHSVEAGTEQLQYQFNLAVLLTPWTPLCQTPWRLCLSLAEALDARRLSSST